MLKNLLLLLLFPLFLNAQTEFLTVENSTYPPAGFFPSQISQYQWAGISDNYVFIYKNNLVKGKPGSEKRDTILRLDDLNKALTAINAEQVKRFPAISFTDENSFIFSNNNNYYLFNLKNKSAAYKNSVPENAANADLEKESFRLAFTRKNNLYVAIEGKQKAVTSEQNPDIVYGSEKVHRNEFGITKGTFWSPGGKKLAFYRMDQSMVTNYPLVDISTRIAEVDNTKYPMAGMASHHVTLGVYDVTTEKIIYLNTGGDPEHYLTNITWSPDGKNIYIAELNRDQNHMYLNMYSSVTGEKIRTLFEETSLAYVEPLNGPVFLSTDPGKFLWQSRRDGFNHIYLFDTTGKMQRQITKGDWEVSDLIGTDIRDKKVFFLCNKTNPLDQQLFSAEIATGETTMITTDRGVHDARVSADGKYVIDRFSSVSVYSETDLTDIKSNKKTVIFSAEDPIHRFKTGKTRIFTIKNENNNDLYCRMITPPDFDSTKKYPVIIYVYGGPHSQLVTDSWLGGAGLYLNFLATKGYIVFTLDNRGTSNRGTAFEQAIFRNVGTAEVSDQMKGVDYLKSLPYVDASRIGINGWSYGGFMCMSMMLRNPGVFKVVVAGGPVVDWKYYEVMYGERYMDTPEANPDGYQKASLLSYVKDLKGKLLIIQGYQDETVVPQNCLSFIKKCVDENKQLDFFVYPGHEHNVRGKDRIHLNQKILDYFTLNL